jgi:hypothetical protein
VLASPLQGGVSCLVGGTSGTVTGFSGNELGVLTPDLAPGTLNDVEVSNADGTFGILRRAFLADFSDVPGSHMFHSFVESIFRDGVTAGCGGGLYCVDTGVTRAQAAVFLLTSRYGDALVLAPPTGTVFLDVPTGAFAAAFIERLAAEGITAGCGGGLFCPARVTTRAEAAVLLLATREGSSYVPPPAVGVFSDVPADHPFAPWIEELARRGITAGCGGGAFCPAQPVTRGQIAVFLKQTFALP